MITKKIEQIFLEAQKEIKLVEDLLVLEQLQVKYLGRKSELNTTLLALKEMPHEERVTVGQLANKIKSELTILFLEQKNLLEQKYYQKLLLSEAIDVSFPGIVASKGQMHPLMIIIKKVKLIFQNLGYKFVVGDEVESDEYNFQRLNLPLNHPARDMQDSFYLSENLLLRTHCTNVTAHEISNIKDKQGTYAVISVGNTFRRDTDDATHSHQFMQLDGFLIAPNISFANLKWTINYFCTSIFGSNIKMRLRPSYFPFTEPSVEVDISCIKCEGHGCNVCKFSGWLEIMGAGMINPLVYKACNQDEDLTGFAFGIGIERIAMLKYNVDDIRRFYTNDWRFLQQFKFIE